MSASQSLGVAGECVHIHDYMCRPYTLKHQQAFAQLSHSKSTNVAFAKEALPCFYFIRVVLALWVAMHYVLSKGLHSTMQAQQLHRQVCLS